MMQSLLVWDLKAFFKINNTWTNSFLDAVLPWMREPYFWAPLYLFLGVLVVYNYKWRGFFWIVFFIVTFAITDQTSLFIKDAVGRLRPCRDPQFGPYVRMMINYCPGGGSFTSSHAANHFGLAMFSFITLRKVIGRYAWLFFAWAFIIGYAQVYVGAHYPLDIIGGAAVGLLAGTLSSSFFQRRVRLELEQNT